MRTVSVLVEHALEGRIGKEITYFWVKDEFEKLDKQGKLENLGFVETRTLGNIIDFIEKFEVGENKIDLDKWIALHTSKNKSDEEKIQLKQAA